MVGVIGRFDRNDAAAWPDGTGKRHGMCADIRAKVQNGLSGPYSLLIKFGQGWLKGPEQIDGKIDSLPQIERPLQAVPGKMARGRMPANLPGGNGRARHPL